jgi:hypothetical protein
VRAEVRRCFRITELNPARSKMEYACSMNLKGLVPQLCPVACPRSFPQWSPRPGRAPRIVPGRPLSGTASGTVAPWRSAAA